VTVSDSFGSRESLMDATRAEQAKEEACDVGDPSGPLGAVARKYPNGVGRALRVALTSMKELQT
jgi:hypothetical protein